MKTSSLDIMYAGDTSEFFYEETNEAVPEGLPVGMDIDAPEGIELVLFSNIYHSQLHPAGDAFWDNL